MPGPKPWSSERRRTLSTFEILIIVAVTAAGATVQGSTGVGLTLVAGPALLAIDGGFAPGPLLLAGQIIGMRHIVVEWNHADRPALRHALFGLPVGMAGGLILLEAVSERVMTILVGSMTAGAAALLLAGLSVTRNRTVETVGGGACAFSSVTAGLPGPPLVIAFSDMSPNSLRPTAGLFVLAVSTTGFIALAATGNFGGHELRLLSWLLPGVAIGLIAAGRVRPWLDRSWFRPTVLTLALLGGLALVIRQF